MKKIYAILALIAIALAGCGGPTPVPKDAEPPALTGPKADFSTATVLQSQDINDPFSYYAVLYSNDATENTDSSCAQGYYFGNFKLAVVGTQDAEEIIVHEMELGELQVPKDGLHSSPILSQAGDHLESLVIVEEYGTCNGNTFSFYHPPALDSQTLSNVKFSDSKENTLFAEGFDDIIINNVDLSVSFYDNSQAKYVDNEYAWNGKKYSRK